MFQNIRGNLSFIIFFLSFLFFYIELEIQGVPVIVTVQL